jgi:hypothetical protein
VVTTRRPAAKKAAASPAQKEEPKSNALRSLDLVACVGGPMHGQWFYLEDWKVRVQAARSMGYDDTTRPGACLAYTDTRKKVPHPDRTDKQNAPITGRALRYEPGHN